MEEMEIDLPFADDPRFDGLPQYAEFSFDEEQLESFKQLSTVRAHFLELCWHERGKKKEEAKEKRRSSGG